MSHDLENDPDIPALIGASAALTLSGIPFLGPIAGARVGYIDGEYILNPRAEERNSSALDLIVAGTAEGVLMVESQAHELSEEVMLGAVTFGHRACQDVIGTIVALAETCAKEPWAVPQPEDQGDLKARLGAMVEDDIRAAYAEPVKQTRVARLGEIRERAIAEIETESQEPGAVAGLFKGLERAIVRGNILKTGARIDGRDKRTVRPILAEVGCLPRAHGSALFTRGETQALVATTLGTGEDEQIMDVLEGEYREHFMLHYNFPPFSVGEAKFLRGPGRREIGHGKLAWRALRPLMPDEDDFPYTIRVVSEITESNGSSSMATVCGASLSLMDAAVPLKSAVAGIAMGLILEDDGEYAVLSDILGDEDHLGDMDFKVAGTAAGITALQMDIKVGGVTEAIMEAALAQAREGRLGILDEMAKALSTARHDIHAHAPRITKLTIPKDKISEIIGTGGKVMREICEVSGAKIDVEDDGTVKVAATNTESGEKAVQMIRDIVAEPEIGTIYTGKVVKVLDFGAFVNFIGSRDGLVHISELADHRVAKVTDIVREGDEVKVKVLAVDDRGKVRLSIKAVDKQGDAEAEAGDHEAVS